MANTIRKNTNALSRDGSVRSSDEVSVMDVERRGGVIQIEVKHQPAVLGGVL